MTKTTTLKSFMPMSGFGLMKLAVLTQCHQNSGLAIPDCVSISSIAWPRCTFQEHGLQAMQQPWRRAPLRRDLIQRRVKHSIKSII
jgi:hypothetical protein